GSFDKLDSKLVTQVYGLVFNKKSQMLIVLNGKNKLWQLPGGKPEAGETYYQTLCRELIEEANIILDEESIKDGFYQNVYKDNQLSCIQLRCCARPKKIKKFISDPDESIVEIKWINLDELDTYLPWGQALDCILIVWAKYNKI
ncbi:MAG: NUDIX hydrolase, partial [Patescibacteria group bacterium]